MNSTATQPSTQRALQLAAAIKKLFPSLPVKPLLPKHNG